MGHLSIEAIIAAVTLCVMCAPGVWHLLRRCYAYFNSHGIVVLLLYNYIAMFIADMLSDSKQRYLRHCLSSNEPEQQQCIPYKIFPRRLWSSSL